ncbi:hypothetical protein RJ639_035080 [Escallonia herrerae]|uniref:7-deoxyloganetic acid glucosyltransferase n=1 Tax=Escallonia herrerae TaxID=1293975 RepID=A0AA89B643_9ASTE|nr:hypothetical protein RJ639_035080 [Escallonia herrerae]
MGTVYMAKNGKPENCHYKQTDKKQASMASPHVLIFPLPLQGPVNSMLKLAELLSLAGIQVTFLNTDHIHRRLLRHTHVQSRFSRYHNFRFQTISDGLPEDNPRSGEQVMEIFGAIDAVTRPLFREMMISGALSSSGVTCIVADGIFDFAVGVAKEIGVPLIYFDTISPCGLWTYLCVPKLIEAGDLPFEAWLLTFSSANPTSPRAYSQHVWDLEGPILHQMRTLCPNLYPIGPLQAHLKARLGPGTTSPQSPSSNSLWEEDKSCMAWLDAQPPKSVIYISIGSLALMTMDQLMEFWYGLVNSGKRFLWVRRPGSVAQKEGENQIPSELSKGTKERGCIVAWAPQEEVLAHPAVGVFLTHSGWNSTLESIVEGVPMICWPYFADQQVNSRFVGEVWKLGMDMKDTCDRTIIEKMVRDVLEVRRDEFMQSANLMAKLARESSLSESSCPCSFSEAKDKAFPTIQFNDVTYIIPAFRIIFTPTIYLKTSDMDQGSLTPHVLIFPLPLQGPVNSMFKLAELLCLSGLNVTFLVTEHIHGRLLRYTDIQSRFVRYRGFRLETISDGLEEDHPRGDRFMELFDSLKYKTKPLFRELLTSGRLNSEARGPVTCVIADGIMGFTGDVASEIGVPFVYSRTISACCLWVFFCLPKLIESGELPFAGDDLDTPIKSIRGMENFLRRRDLPSFCRTGDLSHPSIQLYKTESQENPRAHGLILNTFDDLEGPICSEIRALCPNLYTIGPLHSHLKSKLSGTTTTTSSDTSSSSLWKEDRSCITWLDAQPSKSVIYISFGSLAVLTWDQLMEFWHGVINSKTRFLWVIRPDSVAGGDWETRIPAEISQGTKEKGYIVGWAPQEEVLAHQAVGGFLTHSGWNSTLESVIEGVPMICWPYFMDQQVNSRFVGEAWRLGLDMKDACDRVIVEEMLKDLMETRKDEFIKRADEMANLARKSLAEGGSSYCNLDRLIKDIKSMSQQG